ncbi:polysaccharide deacetylase family protein [Saccharopolyspora sp. ID03-671]|uniref:polysaccharide deacetylase family protein n=1 Tax=Saccharopolyspora sp. ID03-671 TaxID=3073066 RepID=UPI0032506EF8
MSARARACAMSAVLAAAVVVAPAAESAPECSGYVGLTFDDGPGDTTARLLDALRENGLRATMFNQGDHADTNPSLVAAQVDAGMQVGNHSYTHPHMTGLSRSEMDSEISRAQQAISEAGGGTPTLFRPPYGETNAALREVEAAHGLTEIIWDVDSQDWNNATVDQIVAANASLTDGQIILMHDWPPNTLAAIPGIAEALQQKALCPGVISPETGRAEAPKT